MAACGVTTGLLCAVVAVAAQAGPRAGFFAPGIAPRSPQIMLYFSHTVGGGSMSGPARPSFGLRLQQVRQGGNSGDPEAGDSMQHREWLSWQTDSLSNLHLSNMHLKLGSRVTYDLTNRRFGVPMARSVMALDVLAYRNGSVAAPRLQHPVDGSTLWAAGGVGRESARESADSRGMAAAAVAALVSAGSSSAQRMSAQRQGLPVHSSMVPRGPGIRAALNSN